MTTAAPPLLIIRPRPTDPGPAPPAHPARPDAVVLEDDTYHSLSAEPVFTWVEDHPLRVLDEAHHAVPTRPGNLVVRPGTPLRLLAVIHKLDEDPTWRERWIADAYHGVLREITQRRLASVALPLLGTVHGRMSRDRSLELLREALERSSGSFDIVLPTELE